ncbi:MAG: MFS transporter [Candidatus Eremiobacteraeota bacterium]|nr:MFS transporter [Candidatus Eremiobacteraeota bacterium]
MTVTAPSLPAHARALILIATILGTSMVFIDGTVVNIALPVVQRDLHATAIDMQWVVNAYTLFLAALMLVGGSLGDHYGRRLVFVIGTIVFAAASAWCGFAPDVNHLIFARGLQGIGSALLTPGSLAIISATFEGRARGHAIGTWSSFSALTTAFGPALGGIIVQYASWRWIFFINIPLAIAVIAACFAGVPETRDTERVHHLDWTGSVLATIGLGGLTYGLITAGATGFGDPKVIAGLVIGVVTLAAFVIWEGRAKAPMMPLDLFKSPTFSGTNALTFLLYAALGGVLFFVPFNLIQVQHYAPSVAGLTMLPFVVLMVLLSPWAGGLVAQYGSKLPLTIGPLIATAGLALFALPSVGGSYWTTFFPAFVLLGLGMSVTVAPLTTTVLESATEAHVGLASAINNAIARAAGLFAVAAFSLIVLRVFGARLDAGVARVNAPGVPMQQVAAEMHAQRANLAQAQIPADAPPQVRDQLKDVVVSSYVAGFRAAMLAGALFALIGALIAAAFIPARPA